MYQIRYNVQQMNTPLRDLARGLRDILRAAGLPNGAAWALVGAYYALTPLGALADGLAWLTLVSLVAGAAAPAQTGLLQDALSRLGPPTPALVGALFQAKGGLMLALAILDSAMYALLRRRLQTACYERLTRGRWEELSQQQVGRWTGALTEETNLVAKLVYSALQALYSLITMVLLAGLAMAAAPKWALGLVAVGAPCWLALKAVYAVQTRLSVSQAESRQGLAADLNETLTGLFQAKASGETDALVVRALRRQGEIVARELEIAGTIGLLTAMNPLIMGAGLLALGLWSGAPSLAALGGVGVLLFRAASQVNGFVSSIGTLTRLAGSVEPLRRMLTVPEERAREPLPERLASIRVEGASYAFGGRTILDGLSLAVAPGAVQMIVGPSGAGKTTLVNLIAGLYAPSSGRVVYIGASGKEYDAAKWRARFGYVAQEVHLYSGTVRENLDPSGRRDDAFLAACLRRAGAEAFVARLGGLDGRVAEAGRSLSGGERRRLAVARALAQDAEALVLDEATNGLDEASKEALVAQVAALAKELPVIAVTHDAPAFAAAAPRVLSLAAAR